MESVKVKTAPSKKSTNTAKAVWPYVKEDYKILEAWTDREGNIWILAERTFSYSKYALYKISDSGTVIGVKPLYDNSNLDKVDLDNLSFPYSYSRQE